MKYQSGYFNISVVILRYQIVKLDVQMFELTIQVVFKCYFWDVHLFKFDSQNFRLNKHVFGNSPLKGDCGYIALEGQFVFVAPILSAVASGLTQGWGQTPPALPQQVRTRRGGSTPPDAAAAAADARPGGGQPGHAAVTFAGGSSPPTRTCGDMWVWAC